MLTLNDGRNELWQWDTNRKLSVDADCSQVHFSNKVFGRSIDVDVIEGTATIPDILLQTDKELNAWAFVGTAENGYTKISKTFKVNRRNKPSDYVFTPPEQTSLEEIKKEIEYLKSIQDPDAIKNAVDDYLANNPIQIDEKDPTVPAWAKQSTKPSYSKSEVGLGNVDNVKQYSASNPPPYPVTSVNGKTGVVTLDIPDSYTIPDYWQTAADTVVSAVQAIQNISGAKTVNFVYFSDMHVVSYQESHCEEIGNLAAYLMDKCNIPIAVMCGDTVQSDSASNANQPINDMLKAAEYLAPIGHDRLCRVRGNHDATWGAYTSSDTSKAYAYAMSPEKLWQYLFRDQAKDFRRVFSDDGSYFYLDNVPQKTRFICLNSQWNVHTENADGTAVHNPQKRAGYGQAQIEWLASEALDVSAGWSVVIISHVPPIAQYKEVTRDYDIIRGVVKAYAEKGAYSGTYTYNAANGEGTWANVSVDVDFTNASGEIVGWFCGHRHLDSITTDSLPLPIVTVTCAGNHPYDSTEGTRTINTATETALDVVSIDKVNGKIYTTRLGIGSDRECEYRGIVIESFTNQIPISIDTNGSVYNGKGYKENTRISSSSGSISSMDGVDLTGLIPVSMGDIVRMKNVDFKWATVGSSGGLHFYAEDKTTKVVSVNSSNYNESTITNTLACQYDEDENLIQFTTKFIGTATTPYAWLRVCASNITDESIITVNQEIT